MTFQKDELHDALRAIEKVIRPKDGNLQPENFAGCPLPGELLAAYDGIEKLRAFIISA